MAEGATLLRAAFSAAIEAASAARCLPPHLPPREFPGRTFLLAVGKAAGAMAEVAASHLDVHRGLVVFPDGHGPREPLAVRLELLPASHPVPDERGLEAAERALALASEVGPDDRLVALISGGGSALLPAPAPGVSLADKQTITRALLASGASIAEINGVRQCLSRIKGGRLAAAVAEGAEVITLALSDIPGDDIALVASGPTLASRASLSQARAVLARCGVDPPPAVAGALRTASNEPPVVMSGRAVLVARPADALAAAAWRLLEAGYRPIVLGDAIEGDAADLACRDAAVAVAHAAAGERVALVAGGEAAVLLPSGAPPSGRNAHYALALALALDGHSAIAALACDSDGIDGTSPAAGAIVAPDTLERMRRAGFAPEAALARHDAYRAFAVIGDDVRTGPTRTNVNDIRLLLVG